MKKWLGPAQPQRLLLVAGDQPLSLQALISPSPPMDAMQIQEVNVDVLSPAVRGVC